MFIATDVASNLGFFGKAEIERVKTEVAYMLSLAILNEVLQAHLGPDEAEQEG